MNKTYSLKQSGDKIQEMLDKVDNLSKSSVGLENVDNTSDMDKPVSTAQDLAIKAAEASSLQKSKNYTDEKLQEAKEYTNEEINDIKNKLKYYNRTDIEITPESEFNFLEMPSGDGAVITRYNGTSSEVVIPYMHGEQKIIYIYSGAFQGNTNITKVILPNTVKTISVGAFKNCTNLLEINLENVEFIQDNAFDYCTSLTSININKAKRIGLHAFWGCTSLTKIYGNCADDAIISDNAFEDISNDAVFYAEQGSLIDNMCQQTNKKIKYTEIDPEQISTTYETKEDASAKLQEAKDYTDTEIRETTIRLWQPNTEYKVGDAVFTKEGQILQAYYCEVDHTSGSSFSTGEGFRSIDYAYATNAMTAGKAYDDSNGNDIVSTYATKTELSSYSQKPTIITDNTSTTYDVEFLGSTNKIIRLTAPALSELNLTFHDGEYNADLIVNLVFTSGDTATQISYPNTGILNWIGMDCALSAGRSVFIPSTNTRYDVVISFDGTNLLGEVCGYTPATLDNKEDTTTETTS